MADTPLLTLQDARLAFGPRPLFEGVSLSLSAGMRAALVGRNGTGKSTLMKVLAGVQTLDLGEKFLQPGTSIGWLEQQPDLSGYATLLDYVLTGLPEDEADQIWRAEAMLDGVQLPADKVPNNLSGGESRRVALAKALVSQPDVLLLDEPTNHLDMPTIAWLEGELRQFRGALLIISHDRAFLNNVTDTMVWLDRGVARQKREGFANFDQWQEETFQEEELQMHKLDRLIASETKWMREGISGRRKRNMGRVRNLMELRQQRDSWIRGGQQANLAIAEADKSGKAVIEVKNISKRLNTPAGEKQIVENFSTKIKAGDRIGIIGPNGAGKTTLLKMLTGQLEPDNGTVKLGTKLETVYFDQHRAELNEKDSLKDTLCPLGGDKVVMGEQTRHVAGYLKEFLFDPSRMDNLVQTLSGGERNRLLLAKLFAQPSNLMIMDEPTNDLDMDTLDLLEDVIGDYQGTLLLVSHDRDFIDRLVTSTIVLEGDGSVIEYAGGYSDYKIQKQAAEKEQQQAEKAVKAQAKEAAPKEKKAKQQTKLSFNEQRELDKLPAKVDALQNLIATLENALADPELYSRSPDRFTKLSTELEDSREKLEEAEFRWLELEEKQEELQGS